MSRMFHCVSAMCGSSSGVNYEVKSVMIEGKDMVMCVYSALAVFASVVVWCYQQMDY